MSDRLMVCTRKGWFDFRKGADGWSVGQSAHISIPVSIAMVDPRDGAIYAALEHGHYGAKLMKSVDDGASWEELDAPSFAGAPGDKSLQQIWAMAPSGADQPGVIWMGTVPGGLFKSEDGGKSWTLNRPLYDDPRWEIAFGGGFDDPGIHSLIVDPRDSNRVAVGVSVAGFWLTEDGGKSWTLPCDGMWAEYVPPDQKHEGVLQDPHMVVQCAGELDKYWCQHHNGIFRSSDNLKSWQEITTAPVSNFGFAVGVHPHDGETAWFVPLVDDEFRVPVDGKLVVQRTRDGGKSFDVLTGGLPQEDAYHMVFRHAFDVDATGERLVMGSTTGGLWVSDNGGELWEEVTQGLPPIFAVEFI